MRAAVSAEEMHEQAIRMADQARYRERERFHRRWGNFSKCDRCGASSYVKRGLLHIESYGERCSGTMGDAGYSWTARL